MKNLNIFRDINKHTEKLLVAHYPGNSGGKFLLNCVGLSNQAILADAKLAEKQIKNELNSVDKLNILIDRLTKIKTVWDDLNLGNKGLFNDADCIIDNNPGLSLKHCALDPVIHKLSYSNIYFPIFAHTPRNLSNVISHWPNAKIIYFVNCDNFRKKYRPTDLELQWDLLKGDKWPNMPASLDEWTNLPPWILNEIPLDDQICFTKNLLWESELNDIADQQHSLVTKTYKKNLLYTWDPNWYLDPNIFIIKIQDLYNKLNLTDFNELLIMTYYRLYLSKLEEMLKAKIKENNNES